MAKKKNTNPSSSTQDTDPIKALRDSFYELPPAVPFVDKVDLELAAACKCPNCKEVQVVQFLQDELVRKKYEVECVRCGANFLAINRCRQITPNRNVGHIVHVLEIAGIADDSNRFLAKMEVSLNYQIQGGMGLSLPVPKNWNEGWVLFAVQVDPEENWALRVVLGEDRDNRTVAFGGTRDEARTDLQSVGWIVKDRKW